MTIYRIKYRKLGFLFDVLSFIAFMAILGAAALYIVYQQSWLYIAICIGVFIVLKLISKSILAIRIPIDTSAMHNPIDGPEADIRDARIAREAAARIPSQEAQIKVQTPPYKQPENQPSENMQVVHTTPPPAADLAENPLDNLTPPPIPTTAADIPVLDEVVTEPQVTKAKPDKKKRKKNKPEAKVEKLEPDLSSVQAAGMQETRRVAKPRQFKCDLIDELDTADLPDDYAHVCIADGEQFSFYAKGYTNDSSIALETINKTDVNNVTYEEFRNLEKQRLKLSTWLVVGVIVGILICLYLLIAEYNKSGSWPKKAWLHTWMVTTMLPVMALSSFGGIFAGVLLPHKKTRIYILYTIIPRKGQEIRFVTGYRGFKRIRRIFVDAELMFRANT